MCFDSIRKILDFSRNFCTLNELDLVADFTTNATLLTKDMVSYLKDFTCHFQITLDGAEEHHNKIKVDSASGINSYRKTIEAIKEIDKTIPKRWVAIRINFDNETLKDIDRILEDIDSCHRGNTFVILKKVWQLKTDCVNRESLFEAIQKILDKGFLVDYYVMPKGSVCFAEREAEVLINYDGKVFKCTTICSFDKENQLGTLDFNTGEIEWNRLKMEEWYDDLLSNDCKQCKWFPSCLGPCTHQLMHNKSVKMCTFDSCSLSQKEYLMYLLKFNLLSNKIENESNEL